MIAQDLADSTPIAAEPAHPDPPHQEADADSAEVRADSVLALREDESLHPSAVHAAPEHDEFEPPAIAETASPHAGEDEAIASLAEAPDEAATLPAGQHSEEQDERTTIVHAGAAADDDEVTTFLTSTADGEPEEATTLVLASPHHEDEEVTTFLPASSTHALDDEEATTLVAADPLAHEDEATTLVHADPDIEDEATSILPAVELPVAAAAPQLAAPHAEDGVTEIRHAPGPAGAAQGPPDWFTENLQMFTQALRNDAAGVARPPQEMQQLALTARDMIARIAMQTGARTAAEGWTGDTVLQPDQLLANTYIVRSLIARGGVGEIYRTRHRDLRTEHAVKVLLPRYALDPTVLTLMQDEARLLACVRHEAVVRCQDLLRDADGRPMLVMDFLRGRTLSARLREGRLPTSDLIVLARRLAEGLTAIHAAGIIHQDISPDNVILADDSCGAATIIDFGLARRVGTGRDMHRNLDFAGKYSWSSPEQLSGRPAAVDARSDLYSLGLMLAAAARGYRLDMGQDLETARAARTTVPSLAGIEQPLAGLIEALLAPSPDARLGSATDIEPMLEPRPRSLWARIAPYLGLRAPY